MPGPMEGVRVVELGFWVAGPSAGGILADLGADVIKIEPPDGDPYRHRAAGPGVPESPYNYRWIVDWDQGRSEPPPGWDPIRKLRNIGVPRTSG